MTRLATNRANRENKDNEKTRPQFDLRRHRRVTQIGGAEVTLTADTAEQIAQPRLATPFVGREITVLRLIDLAAESLVVTALLVELALVLANVVARVYFQHSFLWTDEIARL